MNTHTNIGMSVCVHTPKVVPSTDKGLFFLVFIFICVGYFAYMYVCEPQCVLGACRVQKRVSDPLELESLSSEPP